MLTIRLSRVGRTNLPHFKVVVQEKTRTPKSNYLEILGHYDPQETTNKISVKKERVEHYLKNGAQPSDTVARLLKKSGVAGMEKFITKYTKQLSEESLKAKQAAEKEAAEARKAAAEAKKAPAAEEAPAAETPAA